MEARKQWNAILNVLWKKSTIFHLLKLLLKNKDEIKTFSDKQKLKESHYRHCWSKFLTLKRNITKIPSIFLSAKCSIPSLLLYPENELLRGRFPLLLLTFHTRTLTLITEYTTVSIAWCDPVSPTFPQRQSLLCQECLFKIYTTKSQSLSHCF